MVSYLVPSSLREARVRTNAVHYHLLKDAINKCPATFSSSRDGALLDFQRLQRQESICDQIYGSATCLYRVNTGCGEWN